MKESGKDVGSSVSQNCGQALGYHSLFYGETPSLFFAAMFGLYLAWAESAENSFTIRIFNYHWYNTLLDTLGYMAR